MAFTFNPVDRAAFEKALKLQATRSSEPRDTIYTEIVLPFIESGHETSAKGFDDNGQLIGYTWADVADMAPDVSDMIAAKDKPLSVETIQKIIMQTANHDRWQVLCRKVANADGTVGIVFDNEKLRKQRLAEAVKANVDAKAEKQAAAEAENAEKSAA